MEAIEKETVVTGSVKGQRERDFYFGRLFGYMSLIKAGCVAKDAGLAERFTKEALGLAEKKAWLAELCHEVVADVLRAISKDDAVNVVLPCVAERFQARSGSHDNPEALLPEQIGLLFVAFEKVGMEGTETLPVLSVVKDCLRKPKRAEQAWAKLANPLRAAAATCPRLHSVWPVVVSSLLRTSTPGALATFWKSCIEKGLLNSTHERKYTALALFAYVAEEAAELGQFQTTADLLTKPLLTCLMNNSASKDRYLHSPAASVLDKLVKVFVSPAKDPVTRDAQALARTQVASILITKGHHRFDQRTQTKTVASLLSGLDKASLKGYINSLRRRIEEEADAKVKKGLLDALYGATKACTDLNERKEMTVSVAEFFFENAFVRDNQDEVERKYCSSRLTTLINDASNLEFAQLRKRQRMGERPKGSPHPSSQPDSLLLRLWEYWMSGAGLSALNKVYKLSEAEKFCFESGRNTLTKMAELQDDTAQGVRLLLCLVLFQIIFRKAEESESEVEIDLVEIVQDTNTCAMNLCLNPSDTEGSEDMPVLIDAMLALLSQASAYIRAVVKTAFALVSAKVDHQSVDVLLDALVAKQGLEKAETAEGEEEEVEAEVEVGEFDGDEGMKVAAESDAEGSDSDEEKTNSDTGEDGSEEEVDAAGVAEALANAEPPESDGESNEEMDDYDKALVAYLKQRVDAFKGKSGGEKLRCKSLHFRQRVLDLVEVLCLFQPTSPVLVLLPCALLDASVSCLKAGGVFETGIVGNESRGLFDRIGSIQRKLYRSKVLPKLQPMQCLKGSAGFKALMAFQSTEEAPAEDEEDEEVTLDEEDQVCALLKSVIKHASKAGNANVATLTSEAANFAIRMSKHLSHFLVKSDLLKDIYAVAVQDCMGKRHSRIPFKFFEDLIAKHETYGWELIPVIATQTISGCKSSFQRCEGLRLLSVALHRLPDKKRFKRVYPSIVEAITTAFQDAVDKKDEGLVKGKRARVLLQVCLDLNRALRKFELPPTFASEDLLANIKTLEETASNGGVKAKAKQFLNMQQPNTQ